MRMYWLRDRENQKHFRFYWRPGPEMLADPYTKFFSGTDHQNQRAVFLTPVAILNALRLRLGKQLPVFNDRERVC